MSVDFSSEIKAFKRHYKDHIRRSLESQTIILHSEKSDTQNFLTKMVPAQRAYLVNSKYFSKKQFQIMQNCSENRQI